MKTLVTGANGFLAGHIIRVLLEKGHSVRAMLRSGAQVPALKGLDVETIRGNVTQLEDVMAAVKDCDYVIHAAADTNQFYKHVEDYFPANVTATENVIQAVQHYGCQRLVFISTANTFGSGTIECPGDETYPQSPLFQRSGYALSKLMAQNIVLQKCTTESLNAVVVNPSFMLGRYDYKPSSGVIFDRILGKKIAFFPPGGKDFVSVETVARAAVSALRVGESGQAYLLTGTDCSYRDFFRKVAEKSGQKTILIPVPGFLIRFFGFWGGVFQLFGAKTALTPTNAAILCHSFYYNHSKATRVLHFEETDLDNLVAECIDWFGRDKK